MCGRTSKTKKGKKMCVCTCERIGKVEKRMRGVHCNKTKKREIKNVCVCQ
jgi:hypothetical protein